MLIFKGNTGDKKYSFHSQQYFESLQVKSLKLETNLYNCYILDITNKDCWDGKRIICANQTKSRLLI
jgi:hypothetical protein